jgi:hypothetical protein
MGHPHHSLWICFFVFGFSRFFTQGRQIWSTPDEWDTVLRPHITTYTSPYTDLRDTIRQVEETIFTYHAGFLIGNQCVDFGKQDGVTEIEEAVMANTIERRLNDLLLRDEAAGMVSIDRRPIYVACVSNFSNFLDLSRKTLRSLEVGIPVIILGRSNTAQHVFRWVELLIEQLTTAEHNLDPGMITYLSGSVNDLATTIQSCPESTGNLYATCSRDLAATLKQQYPCTVASTGGPNTLVVTSNNSNSSSGTTNSTNNTANTNDSNSAPDQTNPNNNFSKAVAEAIKISACIESSGQCTALRHCVVPKDTTDEALSKLWETNTVTTLPLDKGAQSALENNQFDGVFPHTATPVPSIDSNDYQQSPTQPVVHYKINTTLPSGNNNDNDNDNESMPIKEYWRQVSVDFTKLDLVNNAEDRQALCNWLNVHQPISLAVNGPRAEVFKVGRELFDKTGLVVYTLGSTDNTDTMPPALTCQARPQDGECFGEFPPRNTMDQYSLFPVIVPSSNPSYGTTYTDNYLLQQTMDESTWSTKAQALVSAVVDPKIRGYTMTLIKYLQAVDVRNPRRGRTADVRTAIYGLQRPPLHQSAHVYVGATASWDAVAPLFMLYYVTTARDQMILTLHPDNTTVRDLLDEQNIDYHVANPTDWQTQCDLQRSDVFFSKVIDHEESLLPKSSFPMAYLFTLRHLPAGHIKSTQAHDDEFVANFMGLSKKWLTTVF